MSRRKLLKMTGLGIAGVTLASPFLKKASAQDSLRYLEYPVAEPSVRAWVEYTGHLEGWGDTDFVPQPYMLGTQHEHRRLEGFMIRQGWQSENIGLQYFAHIQDDGDTRWHFLNEYCGTKGLKKRLEGFAIRLIGQSQEQFDVYYAAHLQGWGDTGWYRNGEFCGTRGQERRVEAIAIYIADRMP
jgi:uncharacterized protein YjdB